MWFKQWQGQNILRDYTTLIINLAIRNSSEFVEDVRNIELE